MTAFDAVKGCCAARRIFDADEIQSRLVFATDEQTELLLQEQSYTHYSYWAPAHTSIQGKFFAITVRILNSL